MSPGTDEDDTAGYMEYSVKCALGSCSHGFSTIKKVYSQKSAREAAVHHLTHSSSHYLPRGEAEHAVDENECFQAAYIEYEGGLCQAKKDWKHQHEQEQHRKRGKGGNKNDFSFLPAPPRAKARSHSVSSHEPADGSFSMLQVRPVTFQVAKVGKHGQTPQQRFAETIGKLASSAKHPFC